MWRPRCWRPTANSTSLFAWRPSIETASKQCEISRSAIRRPAAQMPIFRLSQLADISLDTGASYIYHERNQRYIPIKFSVRGRDLGQRRCRGAEAYCAKCEAAERISGRMGRRVWRTPGSGQTPRDHRTDHSVSDHGDSLQPVQFASRQPAGAGRHTFCHRRRGDIALCQRPRFQHLRCNRFRISFRCLGHEQHPSYLPITTRSG